MELKRRLELKMANTCFFFLRQYTGFQWFFESQTTIFELKLGSKCVPNRIIDAEGVGKPLDRYLGRYDSALEGILAAPGRILAAI